MNVALLDWLNRNESSREPFVFELHDTWDLCEKRIVLTDTDIHSRFEFSPALAHQNSSAGDKLAGKPLYAEPLGVAVAAIA